MKRIALTTLLLSSVLATSAFAAGYNGPSESARITTVEQALKAGDDSHVTLEGKITKRLTKDERYEFTDSTGTIVVEIDKDEWPAQVIDDKTRVRLTGEIDRDFNSVEVDVDRVEVIN